MSDYTYLFFDWKTRDVIAELPVSSPNFDLKLNDTGNFQGFIQLYEADGEQDKIPNSVIKDATQPGRRYIGVVRGGQLVWAGMIWARTYASDANLLQLNAQTMESYAYKRYPLSDWDKNNFEVNNYIRSLWDQFIESAWTAIGVDVGADGDYGSSPKRNFRYKFWQGQSVGEIIDDIMDTVDSPDYRIGFGWDPGRTNRIRFFLDINHPQITRLVQDTHLTFEFPGNIKTYWYKENVAQAANNLVIQTGGYGSSSALLPVYPPGPIDFEPSYPYLTVKMNQRKISNVNQIDQWGKQQLKKRMPPIAVFSALVESGVPPYLGDYKLGDQCWFYVKDPRFPLGQRFKKRILGWQVTPRRSDSAEDVQITFNGGEDDFI